MKRKSKNIIQLLEIEQRLMKTLRSALMQGRLVAFFSLAIAFSWLNLALAAVWPGIPFLFPYGPLLAAIIVLAATRGRSV